MQPVNLTALRDSFVTMVKTLSDKIDAAGDASTWDGQTKDSFRAELKTLFQGTTTLTTKEVDDKVEQALLDIQNLSAADVGLGLVDNFGTATQAEAEDFATSASDKFVTVERTFQAIRAWWENETSLNPETLDTIAEVAAAIQNNESEIDALNEIATSKVAKTTFDQAVLDLNSAIAAVVADDATFAAGTSTTNAASVKQVHDHVTAKVAETSDADALALAAIFSDADDYLTGAQVWPAAE